MSNDGVNEFLRDIIQFIRDNVEDIGFELGNLFCPDEWLVFFGDGRSLDLGIHVMTLAEYNRKFASPLLDMPPALDFNRLFHSARNALGVPSMLNPEPIPAQLSKQRPHGAQRQTIESIPHHHHRTPTTSARDLTSFDICLVCDVRASRLKVHNVIDWNRIYRDVKKSMLDSDVGVQMDTDDKTNEIYGQAPHHILCHKQKRRLDLSFLNLANLPLFYRPENGSITCLSCMRYGNPNGELKASNFPVDVPWGQLDEHWKCHSEEHEEYAVETELLEGLRNYSDDD